MPPSDQPSKVLAAVAIDLDLDVLAPPDRTFVLGGRTYRLPGDLPARTVVKFMRLAGKANLDPNDVLGGAEATEEMIDLVSKLVARYNEGVSAEEFAETASLNDISMIMGLAAGSPGSDLPDAVVDTLTAGAHPEAQEVDRDDPTELQPTEPAVA